jgi:hypothetical protein
MRTLRPVEEVPTDFPTLNQRGRDDKGDKMAVTVHGMQGAALPGLTCSTTTAQEAL